MWEYNQMPSSDELYIVISTLGSPVSVLLSRGREFKSAKIENRAIKR